MNKILPAYDVHPVSIKMLKKGHPWIIKDKFTEKFHPRDRFIVAKERRRPFALMIHDPRHYNVKARLWSSKGDFAAQIKNFRKELAQRIQTAITKRNQQGLFKERQNVYLIFGEADKLPGVHVQYLGGELLIQYYSFFWENYNDYFIETVIKSVNSTLKLDLFKSNVWIQKRAETEAGQQPPKSLDPNCSFKTISVKEYGIDYKVEIGRNYDCGLYTDMASARSYLKDYFTKAKSVLNLYSYTGAFSLYALKNGAEEVISVDLSEPYLEILEENIKNNEDLDRSKHTSMPMSSKEALDTLIDQGKTFELVISDPPSSSNDGNKRANALKNYEKELPQLAKLVSKGGAIFIFLNTRGVTRNKFERKIFEIIENEKLGLKVAKRIGLGGDCPPLKGFPEGSYLKGLALVHD